MAEGLIPIAEGERLCKKYNAPMVVVFAIHGDCENFTVMTYGKTKKLCKVAAGYGEHFAKAVIGACVKVQNEADLSHLPEKPAILCPPPALLPHDSKNCRHPDCSGK